MRTKSDEMRELIADELYKFKAVGEQLQKQVTKGFTRLRVSQKDPVNLEQTQAAHVLIEKLEALNYSVNFVPAAQRIELENKITLIANYHEMEISWGAAHMETWKHDIE